MELIGKVHKFGDDINTDYIISGRYKFKTLDMNELASHIFEDIDPDFSKKINAGDFIVAGNNFGCGSSREQAVLALKYAKIGAVIAKSFARIFFRNGINVGLILIEADTEKISQNDILKVDITSGKIVNKTTNEVIPINPLPDFLLQIIQEGGIINYLKKYRDFKI
ncbi:MAG TPA: 3-isopropylmalate dehydratase small subunit [Candidatus Ratteibacteria bacterium]|jgi:3-isopropylmalate/(R)-2-methylmalate dehydratase small subunit|uniref:3-isopropylmalate dehydratase small subunit n=1 Tax=candidate division TA06 bacterium ADurb.Bin131 TaxID=1852827 RepID=A0A1V6CDP4_UNCT6|nr:MAG: 2,3-dimethylmalate dehydratase small subunit [candidate division TA06 bacterium ADurb.Bin131]HOC02381.1 3-isopropylmalate dehydratase small subunit [bacterium]HON05322.1 3-isopropylmalate dehydratase small subunit [bacterium]HRS07049.1 3-isopropylmalate dehydratase small subunit [Candidatus Ratteibacteria bacterium]HRV03784.1 3-isopropylmalate dehydratase small subunit [Candidatus Ratteibacteria bacterium]